MKSWKRDIAILRSACKNECYYFWIIFLIGKVCVWGRNALFMWPIYLDIGPQQRIACKKKNSNDIGLVEILNFKYDKHS